MGGNTDLRPIRDGGVLFTKIDKEISGEDEDEGFFRFSREGLPVEKSWTRS